MSDGWLFVAQNITSINKYATAKIVNNGPVIFPTEGYQLFEAGLFGEPTLDEVAFMNFQDQSGATGFDIIFVVLQGRDVGRAHFAQFATIQG